MTIGHLVADIDTAHGLGGKVNPPLRRAPTSRRSGVRPGRQDRLGGQRPRLLQGRGQVR
ncbi:hypothetical protein V2I01_33470 [Micromonospora sp. BRA006-A]|nr:hypothetical protein [Micromonospora sp. BRA006-A]